LSVILSEIRLARLDQIGVQALRNHAAKRGAL
jgi:hypothetical protein